MKPHMAKGSRPRSAVPGCLSGWAPATALLLAVTTSCTGSAPGNGAVAVGKPGTAGVGDRLFPGLGNGGYDVVHYGLTLDYVPETNHLKGTAIITAQATQDLSRFNLDLSGLRVRTTTVQGAEAQVACSGDELLVTPAKTVRNREVFKTVVTYDGTPRTLKDDDGGLGGWIETDDGSTALGQQSGSMTWFPGNHHPSDKATYDITVTVPKDEDGDPYDVISNGELITEEDKGKTVTRHWRTEEPMASYLAHVSIGYFETHKGRTDDDVPVYVAIDPDEAEDSADVPDLVPEIVDWAGKRFGPYPFSSTGAVVDHLPGLDYALETQTKPYFGEAPDEALLVHELAHQWFGNSVTPREWKDLWLSEGLATYAEWLWEEERGDRSTTEIFEDYYDGTDTESEGIWAFPPADPPSAGRVSDPPVYGRGAMAVHKVRRAVGDETFFDILRTWTRQHRHGNADTRQFIALCESKSGKDLTALFNTWLFDKKKPSRM
ncbi:M1 family metallopeptidase [Streptomyces sp. NBC_01005]|uniref:M1 family metallopeptidase n=1 Tax=unclassified Streptomyces TaxID=2593676 RepID=UPI000FA8576A|nr:MULTISPECIES: M1 family metallopeptidase [unclassified Streptomyces]WSG48460.1 M1 family metallopeptidase [Streptomyces sp. NBC_01732]WSW10388.1 M1 family metallopeptidase [Streptomyces sp. NBC_01005]WSW99109.1 M1 family metallopeptidase [Streptomyces sp. NBC_00987]WTC99894.1 M1 family metallopeptidase [Streptomyces sp. NBC_01650]MCX4399455.1 M1 family metallopeptidase [Streptomyces sp. NBC_01767]